MLDHRSSTLTGLLLPLADRTLILPNVAVAELIDYQQGAFDLDSPPWYLGQVLWRERRIPLISFESACGQKIVIGERAIPIRRSRFHVVNETMHAVMATPKAQPAVMQIQPPDAPLVRARTMLATTPLPKQREKKNDRLPLHRRAVPKGCRPARYDRDP